MDRPATYTIEQSWRVVLADLGIDAARVLRRAALPGDLLAQERLSLPQPEYFRLWRALEEEAADPTLALRIAGVLRAESFDPPIFAALCSPDLDTALARIARYKALTCPMRLEVSVRRASTTVVASWLDATEPPPAALVATDLVFFVALARLATRTRVVPLAVESPTPPGPAGAYAAWFGVTPARGRRNAVTFSAADARRPFLTANEGMWRSFEPELRRRLAGLEAGSSTADRVKAALLELLPAGSGALAAVAGKLGTSTRSLQRRLREEGRSFDAVLATTRSELARHYLANTRLGAAEISFLLGYADPNSFYRAFRAWTGATPEEVRGSGRNTASTPGSGRQVQDR